MAVFDDLVSSYPWLADLGISPAWLQETAAEAASPAEVLAKIRATPGYKARFGAIRREDGSLRMSEGEYVQRENDYRANLRYFGYDVDRDFSKPGDLAEWFKAEVAPDEQRTRLEVLEGVKNSSQLQRDAYYVYTGRELSIEDLYGAKVDKQKAQKLYEDYRQATSASIDYNTFITRATQVALGRATEQGNYGIDPEFARSLMDQIHHGSVAGATGLGLGEMLEAFDFAAIGSAAQSSGLGLPTKERLAEIRAAGVERQTAIDAYTKFGAAGDRYNAAVQRARGEKFGQTEFEQAQFLNDAEATKSFEAGAQYLEASGKQQGSFQFDQDKTGRFVQRGLSAR